MSTDIEESVSYLVLTRLLASPSKPLGFKKLKKDLSEIVQVHNSEAEWELSLSQLMKYLISKELIQETRTERYQLTNSGTREAKSFLGAEYLPKRLDWRIIRDQYLVARSLGISISSAKDLKRVNADGIRAGVIRQGLGLDLSALPTPIQAMDSASWYTLGKKTTESFSLRPVRAHLLNQLLGTTRPLDQEQAFRLLAAKHAGARNSDFTSLRRALLKSLVTPVHNVHKSTEVEKSEEDVEGFAREVLQVAAETPTGRHGQNKVFISHVWRQWRSLGSGYHISIQEFKERLIEAHRANKLTLSEADLPDQLDRSDVEESVIPYLNARFHFIRLKGGR